MHINISYDQEFYDLIMYLRSKYPKRLFDLSGIGRQLDLSELSKDFFTNRTSIADISVDPNSNVDDRSVVSYDREVSKPIFLLNAYYVLWKKMKQLYGHEKANKVIENQLTGDIYINDFTGFATLPYCYNYSTFDIALQGLPMITKIKSVQPKYLYSFKSQMEQFITIAANSTLGACMHKDQKIIIKENGITKTVKSKDFVDRYKRDIKFKEDNKIWEAGIVNDNVMVYENKQFVPIKKVFKSPYKEDIYTIKTKTGKNCKVNKKHIFKVLREDKLIEVEAKDLIIYDTVINTTGSDFPIDKTHQDYKDGQFLGILCGDGEIGHAEGYIKISLGSGKEEFVMDWLDDYTQKKGYRYFDKTYYIYHIIDKQRQKDVINEYFPDKKLYSYERNPLGVLDKSLEFQAGFLDGLFVTDGSLHGCHMSLGLTNKNLIDITEKILNNFYVTNIKRREYQDKRDDHKRRKMYYIGCSKSLKDNFLLFNKVKGDYTETYRKETSYFGKYSHKNKAYNDYTSIGKCSRHWKKKYKDDNNIYDVIVEITTEQNDDNFVYEIETETHWYSCGGILTHNTGVGDLFITMSAYVKKALDTLSDAGFNFRGTEDVWKYVKENMVSFIYTINQPMRSASQSPFTNVSIMDDNFLDTLVPDYKWFIDDEEYKADKEVVKKLQVMFLDIMNEELKRTPVTFPVTTACFSIDDDNNILDEKFLDMISEKNMKYGFINIYAGKTSTLSSCCFDGKQKILTKSSNGVSFLSYKDLYETSWNDTRRNFTIYHNGSWVKGKIVRIPLNDRKMYRVITSNNKEIYVTDDHLNPTIEGDKKTTELTVNDYLMFNSRQLDSFTERCNNLTYEQGFIIGLYLGDGSKYKRKDSESYSVTFSLNESNTPDLKILKKGLLDWNIKKKIHIHYQNNTMGCHIYSKELFDIVNMYVKGNYSYEKELDMNVLLESYDFRLGITKGWYASDGGNSNRIYSTSKKLIEQSEALFSSLGINTIVNINDRTGEDVVLIRGEKFNRNYPLYCIRWYDMKNKRNIPNVYKIKNNSEYFKIKTIEEYDYNNDYVYCFEMKNQDEPYFTLPNGIITHNCRLRSDIEKAQLYTNNFGAGSTKIGSQNVTTINLPRLAFKYTEDQEKFFTELEDIAIDAQSINNCKRHILKKRIEAGNHPLYTFGFINLNSQYSTIGLNGFNECLEIMGYDIKTKEGQEFGIRILDLLNSINDTMDKKYSAPHNLEQIPAENVSIKLADKDRLLRYNNVYEIYSNQFIPLTKEANLLDRIALQGVFDSHFSGGAICHLNVDQKIENPKTIKNLIISAAKQGVVYFAINFVLQLCDNGHMNVSNSHACITCGSENLESYTRIVGYLTSVKSWHKKRRELDFPNRQFYKNGNFERFNSIDEFYAA